MSAKIGKLSPCEDEDRTHSGIGVLRKLKSAHELIVRDLPIDEVLQYCRANITISAVYHNFTPMSALQATRWFAMRSQTNQLQDFGIRFAVDQQQIGPEMAFAIILPIPSQDMVALLFGESRVFDQESHDVRDQGIQVVRVLPLFLAFEVSPESISPLNPPHSGRPSIRRHS